MNCSVLLLSRFAAYSPLTLKAVLQQLVEGALHKGNADLFGGQLADMSGAPLTSPSVSPDIGASLLDINCRFGTTVNFSGSVWSVFHAGVIGKGLKVRTATQLPDPSGVIQVSCTISELILYFLFYVLQQKCLKMCHHHFLLSTEQPNSAGCRRPVLQFLWSQRLYQWFTTTI